MSNLDKDNKVAVAKAIQELYINTRKVNSIAGNASLDISRFDNQLETVLDELKELNAGLATDDPGEVVDGTIDLLVTLSELVCIIDGNDDLTRDAPKYLNSDGSSVYELVSVINLCILDKNYIDALGYTEDLTFQLNADMVVNCNSVAESNLSKFIRLTDLQDTEYTEEFICKDIESKGRYVDVYSVHVEHEGETWVVFKSNQDTENNGVYPLGKFLKCPLTFKEPYLLIWE